MPFVLLGFAVSVGSMGVFAALVEYFLYQLVPIPTSPQALLMSQPGLGLTAFNPRRILSPVMVLNGFLSSTALIPSLPDWDQ